MNGRFVAGLDMGSTKVCAAVAGVSRGEVEVMGVGTASPSGVRKGAIADMNVSVEAVRRAVSQAEDASGVEVKAAYVGVSGHVKCLTGHGAAGIAGKEVAAGDLERVLEAASALYVPLDMEVLHVLPVDYAIDGRGGIVRPMGMTGLRLEVNVKVITVSVGVVENLVRCCGKAGVEVAGMAFGPVASCRAVLRREELDAGAVVIDIGGDTTDVAVLKGGNVSFITSLPVGGNHLTNDIAIGLRLSKREAEGIKRKYCRAAGPPGHPAEIELATMHGVRKIQAGDLDEIARPRCAEIFELARRAVEEEMLRGPVSAVVLTGGGSLLRAIDEMAASVMAVPARLATTLPALPGAPGNPIYSTCLGLILYGAKQESREAGAIVDNAVARVRQWARGISELKGLGFGFRKLLGVDNPSSGLRKNIY
jgi:cell division protein FtsA